MTDIDLRTGVPGSRADPDATGVVSGAVDSATTDESLRLSTAPVRPAPRGARRQPTPGPGGAGRRARAALLRGWRQLTSMRTALLLLALLALAAIPGSIFPQTNADPTDVAHFLATHKTWGPIVARIGLFDVFGSPWFAAVYLLLVISLVGCLVPRIRLHTRALRRPPPHAPRRLNVLATSSEWVADGAPEEVVRAAAERLRAGRWRVAVTQEPAGAVSVAAEKGYLRETGNLLFHVALLLMLFAVATSSLFGYKGQVLLVQGSGFANSPEAYASFSAPRVGTTLLPPFSFQLHKFSATYTSGNQPTAFDARVTYRANPSAPARSFDLAVNHPLKVDGSNVYLINDGYAVDLTIRGANGRVIHEHTPFLSDSGTTDISTSHGVIKVPDIGTTQLGLTGELYADFNPATFTSSSSVARNPVLSLAAFTGDLGLDNGVPQNDFVLDTAKLHPAGAKLLYPGQAFKLANRDEITFDGVTPYAVFQVAHDPGKIPALAAAVLILLGITLSLRIRRRRLWVRAVPAGAGPAGGAPRAGADGRAPGSSVVQAAGLARSDPEGFQREFAGLVADCGGPRPARDGSESP